MGIHFVRQAIGGTCMAGVCLLLWGLTTTAFGGEGERVQAAAYYFPNWGPVATSEWGLIQWAKPQFEGHLQPKVPAWGYEDETDPAVMARKIEAAATHGIDAFIFDWYFFDPQPEAEKATGHTPWDGQKYLSRALESGFLKAPNNDRLCFAIMWCNHDVGPAKGAVTPATFDALTTYVVDTYFRHPSAWKIDGKPYFSIYETRKFLESFGNDLDTAATALDRFREKSKAAGLPGVHLNAVLWGLDSSPRCRNAPDWASRRDYPFGAVIVNNTPAAFRDALERGKALAAANPPGHRILTLNSWNEWGEGSYLEPDTTHGMGYLEAVRDVFGPRP